MPSEKPQLYRLKFSRDDLLKLPEEDQLFFVQLGQVANDLRYVSYMCATAEKGIRSRSADERKLAKHQLHLGVRLLYSTLHEGWKVIKNSWKANALGKKWHPKLNAEARAGLKFLGRYFAKSSNLSSTIRNEFGYHYPRELLREPLANAPEKAAEILSGARKRNVFYSFAEEIRSLAMLQAALPTGAPKLWDKTASEEDIRAAAKQLYTDYRRVLEAFEAFAGDVLVAMIKSLRHSTEKFTPPRVTKWADMSPVLFVEEPP